MTVNGVGVGVGVGGADLISIPSLLGASSAPLPLAPTINALAVTSRAVEGRDRNQKSDYR